MTQGTMRAAVYRGVDDVRVERIAIPEVGPGEALVRIHACGVCGTDIKKIQHGLVPPPRVFGHEMAGTITALDPAVEGWHIGDRVVVHHHVPCMECHYCARRVFAQCPAYKRTGTTAGFEPAGGGFAEFIRVMPWVVARGMVRVPDGVSFEEAAFMEPVNTCLKAMARCGVQADDTVLICGQGQIGLLFTQLARLQGARVLASDMLPERLEAAMRFGADAALPADRADLPAEAKARTEGRGADAAIIAVADSRAVQTACDSLRPGGRALLFAHTRLGDRIEVDAGSVCMLEKDLIGSYSSDITLQDETAGLVFERRINVRDLITHRFPLEEVERALHIATSPQDRSLKVMVNP